MIEIILILVLTFLVLTFFYKQAIHEFRLNQIEWHQYDKLPELFTEKVPIILRGRPLTAFWTHEDIHLRSIYNNVPIFNNQTLVDWISTCESSSICPWGLEHARLLGTRQISGLEHWTEKVLNPLIYNVNPLLRWWLRPSNSCWAGSKGLWKSVAPWTAIFVSQGSIVCSVMTEAVESSLPEHWRGTFPDALTAYDTPFIADLKFIDIVLRPGTLMFLPAHWFISWKALNEGNDTICPMVCTVEYHSFISRFAEWTNMRRVITPA
jgi:hypothetical protein